ncbi:MAG: hypothetical protein JW904_15045 [Spirochaetales bacterium]|nr:hypothetical protein [Spirochaetales bacterium]
MTELRPMTLGTIFDRTIKAVFNKDAMKIIGIFSGLIIAGIGGIIGISFWIGPSIWSNFLDGAFAGTILNGIAMIAVAVILGFIVLLIYIVYVLTASDVFSKRFLQQPILLRKTIFSKLRLIPRYLFYLLLISILYGVFFALYFLSIFALSRLAEISPVLSMLGIIGAVVVLGGFMTLLQTFLCPAVPCMVVENHGAWKSIMRSFKLIKPNFFRVLGVSFLFQIILTALMYFVMFLFAIPFSIFMAISASQGAPSDTWLMMMPIMLAAMYIPAIIVHESLSHAFNVVIFYNQKIKTEGYGAEQLAESFISSIPHEGEPPVS